MSCPVCGCQVTWREHDAMKRAVSAFLDIGQVETIDEAMLREADVDAPHASSLCPPCLVKLMAGAI